MIINKSIRVEMISISTNINSRRSSGKNQESIADVHAFSQGQGHSNLQWGNWVRKR